MSDKCPILKFNTVLRILMYKLTDIKLKMLCLLMASFKILYYFVSINEK